MRFKNTGVHPEAWRATGTAKLVGTASIAMGVLALATSGGAARAMSAQPAPTCPPQGPTGIHHNRWRAANRELAPKDPQTILLCRYAAAGGHRQLVASHLISPAAKRTIDTLTHRFDSLKRFPPGAIACPNDSGSEILAKLVYPRRHSVMILVDLTGCNGVTNGDLARTAANFGGQNPAGPRLLSQLRRLTRY